MSLQNSKGFLTPPIIIIIAILGLAALGGGGAVLLKSQSKNADSVKADAEQKLFDEQAKKLAELEEKLSAIQNISEDSDLEEGGEDLAELAEEIANLKSENARIQQKQEERKEVVKTPEKKEETPIKTETSEFSIADLIKKVEPAVVHIESNEGTGSGFVISSNGLILTNNHVVKRSILATVTLSSGSEYEGLVTSRSADYDLALIKIGKSGLQILQLGNSDSGALPQGSDVYTFGYPFGYSEQASFKTGVVARRITEDDQQYIESSAEAQPGNSGGPLVNKQGEVVGISTGGIGYTIGGVAVGETIKLALPINDTKGEINVLKNSQKTFSSEQKKIAREYEIFLEKYNEALGNRSKVLSLFDASLNVSTNIAREKIAESEEYFELLKSNLAFVADKNKGAYPVSAPFAKEIESLFNNFNFLFVELKALYPTRMSAIEADEVDNIGAYNGHITNQNSIIDTIRKLNTKIDVQADLVYKEADGYFSL